MTSKSSRTSQRRDRLRPAVQRTARAPAVPSRWWLAAFTTSALLWLIAATATASRIHFVVGYSVLASGPPQLEPFLASYAAWGFASLTMVLWCGLAAILLGRPRAKTTAEATVDSGTPVRWSVAGLTIAWLPLLLAMLLRMRGMQLPPSYWEPLWLSTWSGISFAWLIQACVATPLSDYPRWAARLYAVAAPETFARSGQTLPSPVDSRAEVLPGGSRWRASVPRWDLLAVLAAVCLAIIGWTWQSHTYYSNFLLGFNDFGHFAQRVANTANGRGVLLESPVLPTFWDHFNPGLLLLVPLWSLFPSVYLIFLLQAVALASGAIFVWGIAWQHGLGPLPALLLGWAWLAQPVLGQMNLAYTYGWHPISLAIPLLLAAIWSLTAQRPCLALGLAILAMSMEEGVIVIVCLFCGVAAAVAYAGKWPAPAESAPAESAAESGRWTPYGVSARTWLLLAITCGVSFVLVYRLSGLAEFQTARFATLGASTGEVVLSPILRPAVFWGSLFRWQKLYFLLSLWLPCFILCLLRAWRPLLVTALPLLVLLVWDHRPATSLAFQYSSTLLPLFWLATIQGTLTYTSRPGSPQRDRDRLKAHPLETARQRSRASGAAGGALATGLILSLFVGQLAYSSPTLIDVISVSYGAIDAPHRRRLASDDDGQWLAEQVRRIRQDGSAVLATGRIAAHVVGNSDVETVGQYLLRRPQLAQLPDRLDRPIAHYRWIVLDRREGFQQTPAEITMVQAEALQAGFRIVADRFGVCVMERPQSSANSGT